MTELEKVSYALGLSIGANLEDQGFTEIDASKLAAGLQDHLSHTDKQLDVNEVNQILTDAMKKANEAKMGDAAKAGEEFLAENAKRDEVTVLESGLQYRVMTEGIWIHVPFKVRTNKIRSVAACFATLGFFLWAVILLKEC